MAGTYVSPTGYPYYGTEGSAEVYAFHPNGANVAFGDGSVRLIDQDIDIRTFAALSNAGGRREGHARRPPAIALAADLRRLPGEAGGEAPSADGGFLSAHS